MNVFQLCHKHNLSIGHKYFQLCEHAVGLMEGSIDVNHDVCHVHRMLDELDQFLIYEKSLNKKDIDFEILLPAICWHDVWKAKRKQTNNFLTLMLEQQYESIGSFLIFRSYIKQIKEIKKTRKIAFLILFHAKFEYVFPMRMLGKLYKKRRKELKILTDMDDLEINVERIHAIKKKFIKRSGTDPVLFRIAYMWITKVLIPRKAKNLHYSYSKNKFEVLKKSTIKEMVKIFNELIENKPLYFDTQARNYNLIRDFRPSAEVQALIDSHTEDTAL